MHPCVEQATELLPSASAASLRPQLQLRQHLLSAPLVDLLERAHAHVCPDSGSDSGYDCVLDGGGGGRRLWLSLDCDSYCAIPGRVPCHDCGSGSEPRHPCPGSQAQRPGEGGRQCRVHVASPHNKKAPSRENNSACFIMAEERSRRLDAVMAEAAEIDAAAASSPLTGTPNVLVNLREAQAQHGLRHGDFARYRCALATRCSRAFTRSARTDDMLSTGRTARTASTAFIARSASLTLGLRAASSLER